MEKLVIAIASATVGYYVGKAFDSKNDAANIAIAICIASLTNKLSK